ncbi:Uncharacterised protein [Mycolicibacterium vanbaalenii]|uniref:Uncharacterized protein n=1 Tax=Mycolicibacterium vanbaalenii TaxID=110539 RepID=A0A5S9RAT7_MYCVN|nr:hypothetical protein [Mycolicibacterium vanbaalenii]CAA0134635.1 Uncharacterised protein [Mycolicibacterium vanbaalenii]
MTETDYVPPDDSYTNADQPVLWEEPEDDVAGDDFSHLGELWLDEGDGHWLDWGVAGEGFQPLKGDLYGAHGPHTVHERPHRLAGAVLPLVQVDVVNGWGKRGHRLFLSTQCGGQYDNDRNPRMFVHQ